MERDDVRRGEQLLEPDAAAARVERDVHPEDLGAPGDLSADPSEADEPEPGAREVAAEELRACPVVLPAALADPPVGRDDVPAGREDQREREVGDGGVEHAGRVRDGDAALAARLDVDEVVADAVVRDEAEVGEEVELGGADAA